MSVLTCRETRRVLNAYHDGELAMDQQVAVQSHLRGCAGCGAERRRLREIGTLLRTSASAHAAEEPGRLERHVFARLHVERQLSWRGRMNRLFDDMHLVWAAAGATAATIAVLCAVIGMMQLTFHEQPTSMAALIGTLSTPGSNRNPVTVDGRMLLPRFDPDAVVGALLEGEEGVFALAAVVTREGRVRNVELLTYGGAAISLPHADVLQLLDSASQARFEPARAGGSPVAVSMIWLVAHTTVRGKMGEGWPMLRAPSPPSPPPIMPVSELPAAPLGPTAA